MSTTPSCPSLCHYFKSQLLFARNVTSFLAGMFHFYKDHTFPKIFPLRSNAWRYIIVSEPNSSNSKFSVLSFLNAATNFDPMLSWLKRLNSNSSPQFTRQVSLRVVSAILTKNAAYQSKWIYLKSSSWKFGLMSFWFWYNDVFLVVKCGINSWPKYESFLILIVLIIFFFSLHS